METNAVGIGPLNSVARNMFRGPRFAGGGEADMVREFGNLEYEVDMNPFLDPVSRAGFDPNVVKIMQNVGSHYNPNTDKIIIGKDTANLSGQAHEFRHRGLDKLASDFFINIPTLKKEMPSEDFESLLDFFETLRKQSFSKRGKNGFGKPGSKEYKFDRHEMFAEFFEKPYEYNLPAQYYAATGDDPASAEFQRVMNVNPETKEPYTDAERDEYAARTGTVIKKMLVKDTVQQQMDEFDTVGQEEFRTFAAADPKTRTGDEIFKQAMLVQEFAKKQNDAKKNYFEGGEVMQGVGSLNETARRPAGIGRVGGYSQKNTPRPVNAPEGRQPLTLTREDGELLLDLTPIIGDIKGGVEGAQVIIQELKAENPNWLLIGVIGGATVAGMIPLVGVGAKKLMMKGANKFKKDEVLEETLNMLPEQDAALVETLTNRSASYKFGLTDMEQNRNISTPYEELVEDNKDLFTEDVFHFSKGNFRGDKFETSSGGTRFDRLGTHVGTADAAKDRAKVFLGDMDRVDSDGNPLIFDLPDGAKGGATMPLRARVDKPFLNKDGGIFTEEEVKIAMNNYADNRKIADLNVAMEEFREELTNNGFTHIPYKNNIEGRDELGERTISHIMLTDRTAGDAAVLKGRFSAFEDVYDPALMKAEGGEVMQGVGSLNETARNMFRGPRGIGAYQQYANGGPIYMSLGGVPDDVSARRASTEDLDNLIKMVVANYGFDPVAVALEQGIDPELALRVMYEESKGNQSAGSEKGARGLMQLMPGTAEELGVDINDALDNYTGGLKYLKKMTSQFGLEKGLAAYNAGPGNVEKYQGVPPFKETQNYLRIIAEPFTGISVEDLINTGSENFMMKPPVFNEEDVARGRGVRPQFRPEGLGSFAPLTSLRPQLRPAPEPTVSPPLRPLALPEGRSMIEKYGLPGDMPEGGVFSLSTASGLR